MQFRELITGLQSITVITMRCLTRQNIKLRLLENKVDSESVGNDNLDSQKRVRHIMMDMIRQEQLHDLGATSGIIFLPCKLQKIIISKGNQNVALEKLS